MSLLSGKKICLSQLSRFVSCTCNTVSILQISEERSRMESLFFRKFLFVRVLCIVPQWKSCFCARANACAPAILISLLYDTIVWCCVDNFYWLTFTCYVYNVFNGKIKIMIEYWIIFFCFIHQKFTSRWNHFLLCRSRLPQNVLTNILYSINRKHFLQLFSHTMCMPFFRLRIVVQVNDNGRKYHTDGKMIRPYNLIMYGNKKLWSNESWKKYRSFCFHNLPNRAKPSQTKRIELDTLAFV